MTDLVRITADRVISKAKGQIKYYNDDGSIAILKSKSVRVFETQEALEQDIESTSAIEAGLATPGAVEGGAPDEGTAVSNDEQQGDESAPAAASRSSKSKRSKGKGKEQMATKKKAPAKKAAAKKASNGATVRMVAGREHDISNYEKVKNASGHTSYDNGDDTATKLRGKTLDEVYAHAAKQLKEPEKDLRAKYKHLNAGMQRMALGNRLRSIVRAKAAA